MNRKNISKLKKLIDLFEHNLKQYKGKHYDEAKARADFIDKFFILLNWDVHNDKGFAEQYRDVVREDRLEIKGKVKAPDYCFRIGGSRKFFVEAKKPAINIKHDIEPAFQLRRYAYTAKLPLSILTDFEEFAVYDTRIKPDKHDRASTARIFYCTYEEYEKEFDFISKTFSREAILKGSFDQYIEDTKRKKGTSEVDKEFLKLIEKWRENLAKNIALRNKKLSIYELNYAVQKIIDRIIFLRIAEDRHIEDYGRIQKLNESKKTIYPELVKLFLQADVKYDSGLFDFQADQITPGLKIDDKILKDIFKSLYYPDSPYEFSVFDVEILGNIYEQFLGKTIRLTPSHQAKVEDKPEVKKAGGVYYTPKYIVDYIVKNTVGEKIKNKTPEQISKLKICDPACGSGSFLLGAYQTLTDYHLNYYTKEKNIKKALKEIKIYQLKENEYRLTIEEKHKILLNNIFGVDIDSQAVEVTKLSLLLKLMEGESQESTGLLFKFSDIKLLPDLSDNIKCGNSLIGSDFYETGQMNLFQDEETTRRINVFDWPQEFPDIFTHNGFDIIIGNPPYVQIQKLKEFYPEETTFYQKIYKTAKEKNVDIYVIFIERSLSFLNMNGVLGFICPNRFFNSDYGDNLREHLKDYNLYHLINFRHYFVFDKVDTYTCLLFLQNKKQQNKLTYKEIRDLYSSKSEQISYFLNKAKKPENYFEIDEIGPHFLNKKKWHFMTENENMIFEKLIKYPKFKEFYEEFFVGIQTSQDKIYILKYLGEDETDYHLYSIQLDKEVHLEKGIVRPIIDNKNIGPYYIIPAKDCVIFPYKIEVDKAILHSQKELELKYPKTWEYLKQNKNVLENREKGRMKGPNWYAYIYPKNLTKQHLKKILIPHVVKKTVSAIDEKGEYCLDNVGANGIILKDKVKEHPYYFLSILNSHTSSFFISKTSIFLSGGFYATNKQFAGEIPIKKIDFSNTEEKKKHNKMVELVSQMLEVQMKYHNAKTENEKKIFKKQIDILDNQIDQLVYDLYGLTKEEIKIVEESISGK